MKRSTAFRISYQKSTCGCTYLEDESEMRGLACFLGKERLACIATKTSAFLIYFLVREPSSFRVSRLLLPLSVLPLKNLALMSTSCPTSYDVTAPVGPLPTVFTPPDPCDGFDCMPPGYSDYWYSSIGYYSPAICPLSHTADCTRPSDLCNGIQGPTQTQGEFAWRCCPRLVRMIRDLQVLSRNTNCISSYSCGDSDSLCTSSNTAMNTEASALGIQIRWKISDLSILQTDPLRPGIIPRSTLATTIEPSSDINSLELSSDINSLEASSVIKSLVTGLITSTTSQASALGSSTSSLTSVLPIPSVPAASNPLSPGTKAGIGVGSAAIAVLALACAFLLFRRHKRSIADDSNHDSQVNQKLAPEAIQTTEATSSTHDQNISELHGSSSAPESPYSPRVTQSPLVSELDSQSPILSHAVLSGGLSPLMSHSRPPSGAISDDRHLQQLKQEHARIKEQKNRLKQLQQLDEQEENLGRLINERVFGVLTPAAELDNTQVVQELPGHETK